MRKTKGLVTVDTIQLNTKSEKIQMIKGLHRRQSRNGDTGTFELVLNPNKYANQDQLFYKDDCINSIGYMIEEMNILDCEISRVDLAYDTYNEGDYQLYHKLNRFLLSLIANKYKIKNAYKSSDLWNDDGISLKIKDRKFDIENYDKSLQEPNGKVTNRFETRVKEIYEPDVSQAIAEAENRTLKILCESVTEKNYDAVVNRLTDNITKKTEGKTKKEVDKILYSKQELIVDTSQLTPIFKEVGYTNPLKRAQRFMHDNNIEKISFNMVNDYAEDIKKAIKNYSENRPYLSFFDQQITA